VLREPHARFNVAQAGSRIRADRGEHVLDRLLIGGRLARLNDHG